MSGVRRALAAGRFELGQTGRNGEQLLLVVGIPLLVLVFFGTVDVLPSGDVDDPLDALVPGVITLAAMSTAMTNLAIATGFDREYGVLERFALTPLRRHELLAGKAVAVVVVLVGQLLAVVAIGRLLGWDPSGRGVGAAVGALVLATISFVGIGLTLAGRLRGLTTLAVANGVYVVLLLVGGVVVPPDELPGPMATIAGLLPPGALVSILRDAAGITGESVGRSWVVLVAWAVVAPAVASLTFRWRAG